MLKASYSTPQELAEIWRCSAEHVLDLIRNKRLKAFSLSKPGSKRPRWRISDGAVAEYESQHQAQAPVTPSRQRQRRKESEIEFYK